VTVTANKHKTVHSG